MRFSRSDVRLATRSFTRHPGFTATAILSLGLAIALNTTMYSVIDAMVRPKVDIDSPEQIYRVRIWGDTRNRVDAATRAALFRTGFDTYEATTFESSSDRQAAEYKRRFQMALVQVVAPNYFQTIGVHPVIGRTFVEGDASEPARPIVISDRLAAALFPDGESSVGKSIDVDGVPHPIIGVIGQASHLPFEHHDVWMVPPPGTVLSAIPPNIVRLKRGISAKVADERLHVLSARFAALAGEQPKDAWFQLSPASVGQFDYRGGFQMALIGAVIAVLIIACVNLANLQLARGMKRSRELALRMALGAARRDIVAQLVLESALLAAAGLVLGLRLTWWGVDILASRIPPSVANYVIAPQTSWRVLVFAIVACVVCVMLVGLAPAIRVSRVDPNELLKSGAGTGATKHHRRQYGIMVAGEIGLSLALLSGAGVVVQSAIFVSSLRPGYDLAPLSAAWILYRAPRDTVVRYADLSADLVSRIRALPDVADAAVYFSAMTRDNAVTVYNSDGAPREVPTPMFYYRIVSPSYLRTLHLPVTSGHDFLEGPASESQIILDKQTAHYLWPGQYAVGKQLKLGNTQSTSPWVRVVGVTPAGDQGQFSAYALATGTQPERTSRLGQIYYLPGARDTTYFAAGKTRAYFTVVRAKTEPQRMLITLRHNLQHMGAASLSYTASMDEFLGIRQVRQNHDFVAATFVSFAALALALTALGIYGIVAHSLAERRRELGVRIALGATGTNIVSVVLQEGNALALAGVAAGLVLTRYTVPLLVAFSAQGEEHDAPLFAAMAFVLFSVAALSALIPALRATRIDPVEALRSE